MSAPLNFEMIDRIPDVCYAGQAREGGRCALRRCKHGQCTLHCAACTEERNHGHDPRVPAWVRKQVWISNKITAWRKAKARKAQGEYLWRLKYGDESE